MASHPNGRLAIVFFTVSGRYYQLSAAPLAPRYQHPGMTLAGTASIKRTIDYRADYWSREFAHLNRRRATWITLALTLNIVLYGTGLGETNIAVVVGYLTWLLSVVVFDALRRFMRTRSEIVWLSTAAFFVDLVMVTVEMYNSGGGWWLGAGFYGVIVAIAALGLPRPQGTAVFGAALIGWTTLYGVLHLTTLQPVPWFGLPSVFGNTSLLATQYLLGLLSLSALWVLLRTQNTRLRKAQESNRRMVQAAPYAIFSMGRDARVREANPAALNLTAYSLEEIVGHGVLRHVAPEHRELAKESFIRTLRGEVVHFEHGFRCGDGVERWFSVSYSPISTNAGEQAVLVIARDLTAERSAALETERMQRELSESRRMQLVGRLVSGVAHELNNPLAAVMSFTEQLISEAQNDDTRSALSIVHAQANRAREIVRDLLQVARDRGERARAPADLRDVISGCIVALRPMAERSLVRFETTLNCVVPQAVVDAVGISQIVDNLLSNAVLASSPGAVVSVHFGCNAQGWEIAVTDQGAGVPEHVRAHLFKPFFTTRAPREGTGLGLAVSQGIAEQHDGTLQYEQPPAEFGSGARFVLRLPTSLSLDSSLDTTLAAEGSNLFPALPFPSESPGFVAMSESRRLLLIDDEAAIRLALQRFLTRRGWQVDLCGSGAEGRDRIMAEPLNPGYDAVLCDLKMPGMTGIDLYHFLHEHRPEYINRLILATGDVASQEVAAFLDTVRCPILEKPFALAQLAEWLETIAPAVPVDSNRKPASHSPGDQES